MTHLHERNFNDLFEALFRHSLDGILLTRLDGTILRASPAACAALGRSEQELRALGRDEIVVPTPELDDALRARQERGAARAELLFRRANGVIFPVELTSTVIPLSIGPPAALIAFRDVTDRKRRDRELDESVRALRESEERFRGAFETLPDAVTMTDEETGIVLEANDGATRLSGYTKRELIGRSTGSLGLWEDGDRPAFIGELHASGSVERFETHFRRKDGGVVDVVIAARYVELGGRRVMLLVTRDVTQERAAQRARDDLEAQLRERHKLEAIGRLAGGIAHDFNNLLTVIFSCREALEEDLGGGRPPNREDLDELRLASERARDLTRQLLAFARRQVIDPVPLDLNQVILGCEKLLRRVIGEDVQLEVGLAPGLWPVRCDRAQLEQVVVNLAVNSRDALPKGGSLGIETANVQLGEPAAHRFVGAPAGEYVRIRVADDGIGMSADVRERMFEPFFTTKEQGKGTGLGLAVVHGIVAQNGGYIHVESDPGHGTTLDLIFPRIREVPLRDEQRPPEAALRGTETILLVEDEGLVREATARSLRKAGYRVLSASSGREAVALASAEPRLDLLLCDVMMPDRNGREVHDAVTAIRPAVRTLFVSGYPDEVIEDRGVLAPGLELLPKPFTLTGLLTRIRQVIDHR